MGRRIVAERSPPGRRWGEFPIRSEHRPAADGLDGEIDAEAEDDDRGDQRRVSGEPAEAGARREADRAARGRRPAPGRRRLITTAIPRPKTTTRTKPNAGRPATIEPSRMISALVEGMRPPARPSANRPRQLIVESGRRDVGVARRRRGSARARRRGRGRASWSWPCSCAARRRPPRARPPPDLARQHPAADRRGSSPPRRPARPGRRRPAAAIPARRRRARPGRGCRACARPSPTARGRRRGAASRGSRRGRRP